MLLLHKKADYISASQLKLIYSDIEEYWRVYVLKEKKKDFNYSACRLGKFLHSILLRDPSYEKYCVYTKPRRGKDWLDYTVTHDPEFVMSEGEYALGERIKKDLASKPDVAGLLSTAGQAEQKIKLAVNGLEFFIIPDYINPTDKIIVEIKSTSELLGEHETLATVDRYNYDLAAYFYYFIMSKLWGCDPKFYFMFCNTTVGYIKAWEVGSGLMQRGKNKFEKALHLYRNIDTLIKTEPSRIGVLDLEKSI